jgi:hypothetical protein
LLLLFVVDGVEDSTIYSACYVTIGILGKFYGNVDSLRRAFLKNRMTSKHKRFNKLEIFLIYIMIVL